MGKRALNRRDFLKISAMSAVGVLAASCAQPAAQVIEKEVPVEKVVKETVIVQQQVPIEKVVKETIVVEKQVAVEKVITATPVVPKFKDPPLLAGLVQAGQLPPIEERLPDEPMVIEPLEKVGQYGGTIRTLYDTVTGTQWVTYSTYETMLRWSVDAKEIEPNIAKAWEISPDGKSITLFLRKGTKYSDGAPFTADDFVFYWQDVAANKELTPAYPVRWTVGGQPTTAEKVDDYTIRLVWAAPNGFILQRLAYCDDIYQPAHYVKQFHASYADKDALAQAIKEAGLERWDQLYTKKADWQNLQNPDYPVLRGWYPTTEAPSTRYIFKRNPYYWKVDPQGNQLPYIDELIVTILENAEVLRLQVLGGKSDLQELRMSLDYYPLLKENEEKGGYRVLLWENGRGADPGIYPNQNTNDPALRALIQDDRFRFALSLAINRPQVNEMVFLGMGKPQQATISSSSPCFKPEYAQAYADYNPDKANAYLDEMGLTKRDKDGYRLRPDGQTLLLIVDATAEEPTTAAQLELVKQYWEAIGIKTEIQLLERALYRSRRASGEQVIGCWALDYVDPFEPGHSVPYQDGTNWAVTYGRWFATGGKSGDEPTGDIRKLQLIWKEISETPDWDKQMGLCQQMMDLHAQHVWMIGIIGEVPIPIVVNKNIRNIPEKALRSFTIMQYLGPSRMEQLYYE